MLHSRFPWNAEHLFFSRKSFSSPKSYSVLPKHHYPVQTRECFTCIVEKTRWDVFGSDCLWEDLIHRCRNKMWWRSAYGAVCLSPFQSELYSNHVIPLSALLCCHGNTKSLWLHCGSYSASVLTGNAPCLSLQEQLNWPTGVITKYSQHINHSFKWSIIYYQWMAKTHMYIQQRYSYLCNWLLETHHLSETTKFRLWIK